MQLVHQSHAYVLVQQVHLDILLGSSYVSRYALFFYGPRHLVSVYQFLSLTVGDNDNLFGYEALDDFAVDNDIDGEEVEEDVTLFAVLELVESHFL